jgi:SAM-dependent methyltransferase
MSSGTVPDYGPIIRHMVRTGDVQRDAALDVACGTGITTDALAQEFERVVGLDLSSHMLDVARKELRRRSNVELLAADFRNFHLPTRVALVVCSGDALNYAQSVSELEAAFRCIHTALRPGGLFLFDLQSEMSLRRFNGMVFRYRLPDFELYQVWNYDPATQVSDSLLITPHGVETHRRRAFTRDEVHATARAAGLQLKASFASPLLNWLGAGVRDFYELRRPIRAELDRP